MEKHELKAIADHQMAHADSTEKLINFTGALRASTNMTEMQKARLQRIIDEAQTSATMSRIHSRNLNDRIKSISPLAAS